MAESRSHTSKKDPLYINDDTFRVFLVPVHEKIFIFFITRDYPLIVMSAHFAKSVHPQKIFFSIQRKTLPPNMLMTAEIAFSSYRGRKIFLVTGVNSDVATIPLAEHVLYGRLSFFSVSYQSLHFSTVFYGSAASDFRGDIWPFCKIDQI